MRPQTSVALFSKGICHGIVIVKPRLMSRGGHRWERTGEGGEAAPGNQPGIIVSVRDCNLELAAAGTKLVK